LWVSWSFRAIYRAADRQAGVPGHLQGSIVERLRRNQRVLQLYDGNHEVPKMLIRRSIAQED
jgi:hypothetical protein